MIRSKELEEYCKSRLLEFEIDEDQILVIDDLEYHIVDDKETIFDDEFNFLPKSKYLIDGFVYNFCGRWYIQDGEGEEVNMQELSYIGKSKQKIKTHSFIGIHSGNELLNGVGLYEDWVKKAKFLGVKNLGICEMSSLSGVIDFQKICISNGIKPITGISIPVKNSLGEYNLKIYVKGFQGWQNILKFNALINVEENLYVDEAVIIENLEGLHIVVDPKSSDINIIPDNYSYYQLDTVIFEEEEKDAEYINNLEKFMLSDLQPVAIYDAYYLEKEDYEVREYLWGIAKSFDYKTKNQYFKCMDEYAKELINMFEKSNKSWIKLFKKANSNLELIVSECNFEYDTTSRHLPKYQMTEDEASRFDSNEKLFLHLIKKGFEEKNIKDKGKYIERLKEEIKILKDGDVIDYFLVLYDIVSFAKKQDILVGIGRGSAGGSLVSYLLDIIQIDPLEFDLLFARFLNPGRMGEFKECVAYEINTSKGIIKLNEKSILKVIRNKKEIAVFVEELLESDIILRY